MSYAQTLTVDAAFARYEEVRHRLPGAAFPVGAIQLQSLADVAPYVDAFVLDAFGVLNVGQTPIPGAVERMSELRAMGKKLRVLTNAASDSGQAALRKYHRLGFDFSQDEVVSSRDVCADRLKQHLQVGSWGALCADGDEFTDLHADIVRWGGEMRPKVDGFLMLSSAAIDPETFANLRGALESEPRPLLVANPDVVAPRENGLSLEPGYYAHALADAVGIEPVFFGKPFQNAYDDVKARLEGVSPDRIAMVGDTLHTDVLGGAAAGFKTVLIEKFGLFANRDVAGFIAQSGIVPDYICAVT